MATHHPYGAGRGSGKTPGPGAACCTIAPGWCGAAAGVRQASDDWRGRPRQACNAPRLLRVCEAIAHDAAMRHAVRPPLSVCP